MTQITVERTIRAPVARVFKTVADIREFSKALPHIVRFEFLSQEQTGPGTRFREFRMMRGKEMMTELEVTEHVDDDHVRMVADSHGAVWDTVFSVADAGGETRLTMTMEARPYKIMPRLMIPLTKGMISKAVARDMDLIQEYCEANP